MRPGPPPSDWHQAANAVHRLKGSAGVVGAQRLMHACAEIEQTLRTGEDGADPGAGRWRQLQALLADSLGALDTAPAARASAATPSATADQGDLRACLVTIHVALDQVPELITAERVARTARVVHESLKRDFAIARPRLAMAALNPHAGEGGALGLQEIETLIPVAEHLRGEGIDITDPRPADTLFHDAARATYDAVICMYHDQALIPVKTLDFWGGVNVSLGLPIIRTSPDHGTAFDIAGKGIANHGNMNSAIAYARKLVAGKTNQG